MAYAQAGLPKSTTFIIDKTSKMKAVAGYAAEITSYDDPKLVAYIFEMIALVRGGHLPTPPVKDERHHSQSSSGLTARREGGGQSRASASASVGRAPVASGHHSGNYADSVPLF